MSVATPVKTWVATVNAGAFMSHGQTFTALVNLTQAWEIQVPVGVRYGSNVSLATAIYVLPTSDGGNNYDSEPLVAFSVPTTASARKTESVRLTTGMYSIVMIASSPSVTFFLLTQEVVTAFNVA